jgi:hypothetical protein
MFCPLLDARWSQVQLLIDDTVAAIDESVGTGPPNEQHEINKALTPGNAHLKTSPRGACDVHRL